MRRCIAVLTYLFCAASVCAAQADAKSLLRDAAARYRDAKSFRLEWETKITTSSPYSNGWSKQMYVAAAADNKYHLEVKGSSRVGVRISDGQNDWFYSPSVHEYSVQPADTAKARTQAGTAGGTTEGWIKSAIQTLLRLDDDADAAELLREETLTSGTTKLACYVVEAKRSMAFRQGVDSTRDNTYWIEKSTGLLRKAMLTTHGPVSARDDQDNQTRTVEILYTRVDLNTTPDPALFQFTPPADAYLTDDARQPVQPLSVGLPAPALKLKNKNDIMFDLADLKGKVVVVQFWASWCGPCLEEMKALAQLPKRYSDRGLVIVSVDEDDIPERGTKYFAAQKFDWMNLHDAGGLHRRQWGVTSYPSLAIVNREGKTVWMQTGFGAGFLDSLRAQLDKPELTLAP